MALSDLAISNLSPKPERYEVHDGGGLYIRIMPKPKGEKKRKGICVKSWVLRYMVAGKARRMTLGQYPGVSAADARQKALDAKKELQRGIDPIEQRKQQEAAKIQAPDLATFFDEYWRVELQASPSGKERRRLFDKDILPRLGGKKIAKITLRDVVLVLTDVRERAPAVANRLQGVLVRLFNFAAEHGVIDFSPLTGLKKKAEPPRKRVLTGEEIKLFWEVTDTTNGSFGAHPFAGIILRLILLTGQRPGEVMGMKWEEIHGDTWNIPGARRKGNFDQSITLGRLALETIEPCRLISGDSPFVFQSPIGTEERPFEIRSLSRSVARNLKKCGFNERWTPHDLRRTCRTGLADLGISDMVAEQVLGHKMPGIMGVYNQHSYANEKRAALKRWEWRIRRIVGITKPKAGKVIPIRRAAG